MGAVGLGSALLFGCASGSAALPHIDSSVSVSGGSVTVSYRVTGKGKALISMAFTYPNGHVETFPFGDVDNGLDGQWETSGLAIGSYSYKLYEQPASPEDNPATIGVISEKNVVQSASFHVP